MALPLSNFSSTKCTVHPVSFSLALNLSSLFIEVTNHFGQQSGFGVKKRNNLDNPPTSSVIGITKSDENYNIIWSSNRDNDFSSYKLYESSSKDMTNKNLIKEYNNSSDTTYVKSGVQQNEKFYYQIVTSDYWGLTKESNVDFISTLTRIVYLNKVSSSPDLFLMDIDGDDIIRLTNDGEVDNPHFSPDGKTIVYNKGYTSRNIYTINIDGSNKTQLTNTNKYYSSPQFSPDGTKIIFSQWKRVGNSNLNFLSTMDINGNSITQISTIDIRNMSRYSLSKDTDKITFIGTHSMYLYTIDIDGNNETLVSNTGYFLNSNYSPDGTKIVYQKINTDVSNEYDIHLINSDGSNNTNLTNTVEYGEYGPVFTHDGNKIIYVKWVFNNQGDFQKSELYIMDIDGNNNNKLIDLMDRIKEPKISYDDKKILFHTYLPGGQGHPEIFIVNIDGTDLRKLKSGVVGEVTPQFQPR